MQLFFILGREPALSATEIFSVLESEFGQEKTDLIAQKASLREEVLRLDVPDSLKPQALMDKLGGTIKIGQITETLTVRPNDEMFIKLISDTISKVPHLKNLGRIRFGISIYDGETEGLPVSLLASLRQTISNFGIKIKRTLEKTGLSVRWVISREPTLSSVVVKTNRLLSEGVEIVVILEKERVHLGYTLCVQPFEALEARDFLRPGRDTRSGMLPPKLARMLVNLAQPSPEDTLLDPFCGSGTILAESLLLGYQKLIGGDLDPIAIKNTKQNVDWMIKNQLIKPDAANQIQILHSDIRNLVTNFPAQSIKAMATETYLGPPMNGHETQDFLKKTVSDLATLYRDSLRVIKKLLTPDGRAIIAFPILRYKKSILETPVLSELDSFDLMLAPPLPQTLHIPKKFAAEFGRDKKTLIYGRADQRVWREIAILKHS